MSTLITALALVSGMLFVVCTVSYCTWKGLAVARYVRRRWGRARLSEETCVMLNTGGMWK